MLDTSRTDIDVAIRAEEAPLPKSFVFLVLVVSPAAFWSVVLFFLTGLASLSLVAFVVCTVLLSAVVGLFPSRA